MVLVPDSFVLLTSIVWDGFGPIVDQLKGTVINVDGYSTGGTYVGESTTAVANDADNDGLLDDLSGSGVESIDIADSATLTGGTSNVDYVVGINGYTIRLLDGTTFTDADFGQLPVRVNADGSTWIDYSDSMLSTLNGLSPVASITFNAGATQVGSYSGYYTADFDAAYTPVCFVSGTLIETISGPVAVENLKPGDRVQTLDAGLRPIRWISCSRYGAAALAQNEKLRPVTISAGALGGGLPRRDLRVSRQHRVLLKPSPSGPLYPDTEVLVAAIKLTGLPGIYIDRTCDEVAYYHMLLDQHQVVISEGLPTESLLPGPQALKTIRATPHADLLAWFPEFFTPEFTARPARPIPSGKDQKRLVESLNSPRDHPCHHAFAGARTHQTSESYQRA